jgi:predicted ester cyclase
MTNTKTVLTLSLVGLSLATAAGAAPKKETARQVMDRFFAAVDSKQPEKLAEVDAADLEMSTPMGAFRGVEGHKQLVQGFGTAFPNFKHTVTRCVEQGSTISCEGRMIGDHTGPLAMPGGPPVPATQKHIDFPWSGFATVAGGKVTSVHVYFDPMVMMRQLGLVPPPPATAAAKP